ncbi:unnamed protein product [Pylaiella littoralis]
MKMIRGEPSLRMPKEATCDVECAMKVEEIRILSKKRKQSQRVCGDGDASSKGAAHTGKGAKRPLSSGSSSGSSSSSCCGAGSFSSETGGSCATTTGTAEHDTAAMGGGGGGNGKDASRRRFVWSVPLHQDFVAAVFDVGLKCASPKLLLEMMPVVDGLTSEHIKSHLQKYRLHRQRSREEFLKSYNYLTDLDGGKGLGGGTAAATIARAATVAASCGGGGGGGCGDSGGDSKVVFASCRPGADPEQLTGCGSGCECEDTSGEGGGGGSVEASTVPISAPPTTTSKDEGAQWSGGGAGGRVADADVETQQVLQDGGGDLGAVNSALLLSHLELLAKGIDMQVSFHNHLRDVVESQQLLHAQLAERRGSSNGHLRQQQSQQQPAEGTGSSSRLVPSSAAGVISPSSVGLSPSPMSHQHAAGGGGVRVHQHEQVPRRSSLLGGGGGSLLLAGSRTLPGQAQAAPGGLGWPGADAGTRKSVDPPNAAERGGGGSETPWRGGGRTTGLSYAGTMQSGAAAAAVAAASCNVSVGSARAGSGWGGRRDASDQHPNLSVEKKGELENGKQQQHRQQQQQQHQQQQQQQQQQLREAFSVQTGAGPGRVSLPQGLLSMGRQTSSGVGIGAGSRGYVPGEYTLTSKTTDTAACAGAANAQGQAAFMLPGEGRVGAHASVFGARSPAEARAALAAAGLAPATPTAARGQENLTLQRHMQAQMSMQQSMLSACNDQATSFGQRPWCGGGGVASPPALHRCGTGGGAEAGEEGNGGSGRCCGGGSGGSGGGGEGGRASAGSGSKEQRLDPLSLHPAPDPGDPSAIMDVLHQDDMFDFGMLDRGGELKAGDNPAGPTPARPTGDEHSTLFSFLME